MASRGTRWWQAPWRKPPPKAPTLDWSTVPAPGRAGRSSATGAAALTGSGERATRSAAVRADEGEAERVAGPARLGPVDPVRAHEVVAPGPVDTEPAAADEQHDEPLVVYWDAGYNPHLVPASAAPSGRPVGRRWREDPRVLVLVLVAALVLIVSAGWGLATVLTNEDDVASGTTTATDPPTEPSAGVPGAPPAEGVLVTAAVRSGDVLEVSEVVTWLAGGPVELTLELADLASVSGITADFAPSVSDLQVTVDGSLVAAVLDSGSTNRWLVQSPSGDEPSMMEVRYLLAGAIVRSTPSPAGRGLAVIAPLSQPAIESLPVRVELPGDEVLTISCPGAPDVAGQLCGRQDEAGWSAEPAPSAALVVVVVQLDLAPIA